jgi:hypothetical protein
VVARNPGRCEEGGELAQMLEVGGKVVELVAAAVDGQHVEIA